MGSLLSAAVAIAVAAGVTGLDGSAADRVQEIEVNTFGDQPRTALIYRDASAIRDWRWIDGLRNLPVEINNGRFLSVWNDLGRLRVVRCRRVTYTRTREDVELLERRVLPEQNRAKLSK